MKTQIISLKELIEIIKESLSKSPKVKNHDQLVSLKPQLELMLSTKGNINIPTEGLNKILNK